MTSTSIASKSKRLSLRYTNEECANAIEADEAYDMRGATLIGSSSFFALLSRNNTMFVNGDLKGKFIMDRNLGARDTNRSSTGTGVLYYQAGRKDPFAGGVSGLSTAAYEGGSDDTWTINNLLAPVEIHTAINKPMNYYYGATAASNWCLGVDSETYVWNDFETDIANQDKSIFDPSPRGWKIAPQGTYNGFAASTMTAWDLGRWYPVDAPFAFFPAAGYRWSIRGTLESINSYSFIWTSTPSSTTHTNRLWIGTSVNSTAPSYRVDGFNIRSVQHYE